MMLYPDLVMNGNPMSLCWDLTFNFEDFKRDPKHNSCHMG
jgi:hypothetical protein